MHIKKELLKKSRLADFPSAWILQAKGFRFAAEEQLQSGKTKNKFISSDEAFLLRFSYKTACYLLAHSIELSMKALYKLTQTKDDKEAEKYSHDLLKLESELVKKDVLKINEVDKHTLELANILLAWFGRYHKPLDKQLDSVIENLFIESKEDPNLIENKYSINSNTYTKLVIIADCLLKKVETNQNAIEYIFFDPFL